MRTRRVCGEVSSAPGTCTDRGCGAGARAPERVSALASVLGESALDLHLGVGEDPVARLGPALLLIPLPRLRRVQLCAGAVPGEARERVLVLGEAPARERGRLLRALQRAMRRVSEAEQAVRDWR